MAWITFRDHQHDMRYRSISVPTLKLFVIRDNLNTSPNLSAVEYAHLFTFLKFVVASSFFFPFFGFPFVFVLSYFILFGFVRENFLFGLISHLASHRKLCLRMSLFRGECNIVKETPKLTSFPAYLVSAYSLFLSFWCTDARIQCELLRVHLLGMQGQGHARARMKKLANKENRKQIVSTDFFYYHDSMLWPIVKRSKGTSSISMLRINVCVLVPLKIFCLSRDIKYSRSFFFQHSRQIETGCIEG